VLTLTLEATFRQTRSEINVNARSGQSLIMKKMTMMGSLTLTRAIWKALKRERTTTSIQRHSSVAVFGNDGAKSDSHASYLKKHSNVKEQWTSVNKIAFSANDDKRIIQPGKIQTLAYGFRARGALGGREQRGHKGSNLGHEGNWQRGKGLQLNGPKAWKSDCDVRGILMIRLTDKMGIFSSGEYKKQTKK